MLELVYEPFSKSPSHWGLLGELLQVEYQFGWLLEVTQDHIHLVIGPDHLLSELLEEASKESGCHLCGFCFPAALRIALNGADKSVHCLVRA